MWMKGQIYTKLINNINDTILLNSKYNIEYLPFIINSAKTTVSLSEEKFKILNKLFNRRMSLME